MIGISEYLGEEPGLSLIPRRIWPDPPHRQSRRQNHPAARLPAASGTASWPGMADKAAHEAERGAEPVQWDGESIRRRFRSRRETVAGERGAKARVEPGGMARGGTALGAESMSARISASWSSGGKDMAQLEGEGR
jgi:hypothetical protein